MKKFWQVDAFTSEVFKGNPAAVFIVEDSFGSDSKYLQKISTEMNLSETVFVSKNVDNSWQIRWMTPNSEVDLCGHATLAASHVLFEQNLVDSDTITFQSKKSGTLNASKKDGLIWLDFPIQSALENLKFSNNKNLTLGFDTWFSGANGHDAVLAFNDPKIIENYKPNLDEISKLDERGFIITAPGTNYHCDYVYRAFFPKLGIIEDPVTGSANTALAPLWAAKLNKTNLTAKQISDRTGDLNLVINKDRLLIGGKSITVFEGFGEF